MAFVRHWRMSLIASLGGASAAVAPEDAQININLAKADGGGFGAFLDPNDTVWSDLRDDAVAWWQRQETGIMEHARLRTVKFADIGTDGRYLEDAVVLDAGDVSGGFTIGEGGNRYPFQIAHAVTLLTDTPASRVKGRFYIPCPAWGVDVDGRISAANCEDVAESTQTFLNDVNNQPGIDVLGLRVVVASQGRQAPSAPPTNYVVDSLKVGRVLDTIRSRREDLSEAYTAPLTVS